MGRKKEKQHEISGPGASGPPGARGHEELPTGPVGRCSVPQPSSLLVPPAGFSVGSTQLLCNGCASERHPATVSDSIVYNGLFATVGVYFVTVSPVVGTALNRRAAGGEAGLKINFSLPSHATSKALGARLEVTRTGGGRIFCLRGHVSHEPKLIAGS